MELKKTNTLFLIISVVILLLIIMVVHYRKKSEVGYDLKDFAFEDTASITKIFMVNKDNLKILLERKTNFWVVNGKYKARTDAINNLLDVIASMEIKAPVPSTAFEQVVKLLATRSTKVEIYTKKGKVKSYYIGEPTPSYLGNYMILENSTKPYIVHKPGFTGYISVRFFLDESEWRSTRIFEIPISHLFSIEIIDYEYKNSYKIIFKSINDMSFLLNNSVITQFDTLTLKLITKKILTSNVDRWTPEINFKIDSLKRTAPYIEIILKSIKNEKYKITLYRMPNIKQLLNSNGVPFEYDPDLIYGVVNDTNLSICQYFVFDEIILPLRNLKYLKK